MGLLCEGYEQELHAQAVTTAGGGKGVVTADGFKPFWVAVGTR